MNRCAVTEQLNRYLDEQDKLDREVEYLNNEVERLMKPGQEFYPYREKNFWEAMNELDDQAKTNIWGYTLSNQDALLMRSIREAVESYWEKLARSQAERDLAEGDDPNGEY